MIKDKAINYFTQGKYNCCQAVICAFCDEYGIPADEVFKLTEAFGSGMGGLQDTCGAVTGMFMAISMYNSAGDVYDPLKTKMDTYASVRQYAECFKQINGSIYCRDLKKPQDGSKAVSCNTCVETAAALVDKYIELHK